MSHLLHHGISENALRRPHAQALQFKDSILDYAGLQAEIDKFSRAVLSLGVGAQERVAVYLEKRPETVISMFGACAAGTVFVPLNPLLKPPQVGHILRDCNVRVLITSAQRLDLLKNELARCPDLRVVLSVGSPPTDEALGSTGPITHAAFDELLSSAPAARPHRSIDTDIASILYTSGSTGKPKGVVLSHRNMVAGAESVSEYLSNTEHDRILSVLPLSFDAGFSQLSTAFLRGACAVLINYLLPRDVIRAAARYEITGIGGVPPIWIPLARLEWPPEATTHLRYVTNTGGAMPKDTVQRLANALPSSQIFLMYGLTEAFRSTYLPPEELPNRPDSIGKAIPNAEILVVRPDGERCGPGEPGELVHRGALVAQGYWNDAERTAERFKPAPGSQAGRTITELAVWSGDTVRMDEEGYLYFVGRRDEMIKTSGYRVSPGEVEEMLYETGLVSEAVAVGVPHVELGQVVVVVVVPAKFTEAGEHDSTLGESILGACRELLPNFMVPSQVDVRRELPRNPNGKIDRKQLSLECTQKFGHQAPA